jgi:chromosomal replication initiator protein
VEIVQVTLWEQICGEMKTRLSPHLYHSFVEGAGFQEIDPKSIQLNFTDRFSKENFEEKCLPILREVLQGLQRNETNVVLAVDTPTANREPQYFYTNLPNKNLLDSKYTFETFVVGSSNQFAHAACQAVSKQPGQCYNPLFIFGGAGLGKTHLLRAIGYELLLRQKDLKLFFLTTESFTNELIQAIRLDRMREFRDKYRTRCDVLLLDDIQFLAGKERTQEEFFYTFNYLHELRKQIVITADRYPKDIQGLENRLQTRFEWGLVADVQPPEVETRIAILKNKADEEQILLPDPVASYIASNVTSNIRELEGALHRLQAYASLTSVPISLELAQQILKDIAPKVKHELTADAILKLVALQFNVRTTDLKSDKRVRKLSFPRQVCMYLLRKHLLMSFPEIGRFMGGKDHTTVLHAVSKIAELQRVDPDVLTHITAIEGLIR